MLIVIENVLSKEEITQFRAHLAAAQWQDGSKTAGTLAAAVKHNQQIDEDSRVAIELGNHVLRRLGSHPLFLPAALPEKIYPPKFNRYSEGGYYGTHVDGAVMPLPASHGTLRSDLSATLFLCSPQEYAGGELVIEDNFGSQRIKLEAGDLVLYPSTSLHTVTPVSSGARTCAVFWLQSMVRSNQQRETLFELDQSVQALTAELGPSHAEVVRLSGVYHNLIRQWADT